jgi:hypothetical protein
MTITEFCDRHDACPEGRAWAIDNCASVEDAWGKLPPEYLIWAATREGVLTKRELRLFAVWSARQVQHLLTDPRSFAALDVAERHANGEATNGELDAARDAAMDAAWDAARCAARDAAWDAARCAARDAARDAARCAAMDAARDAARAPARDAAMAAAWDAVMHTTWSAAMDAARDAQAAWLRANTKPNFGGAS